MIQTLELDERLQLFYKIASKPDEIEENPATIGAVLEALKVIGEVADNLCLKEYYLDEEELRDRVCWIKYEIENGLVYGAAEATMCALNYIKKNDYLLK